MKRDAVDRRLHDWFEHTHKLGPVHGRGAPGVRGGNRRPRRPAAPPGAYAGKARAALRARAERAPQVMLKITNTEGPAGGKKSGEIGRSIASMRAHLEYLLKDKDVEKQEIRAELENQDGRTLTTAADIRDELAEWEVAGHGIPKTHTRKKDLAEGERRAPKKVTNMILSMPAGTNPEAVRAAAREFVADAFAGHDYIMAFHQDRGHPHMHVSIRNESQDGTKRLHAGREQLLAWRETFAAKLYEHGIAAAATPRASRNSHAYLHKAYVRGEEIRIPKHAAPATPQMTDIQRNHARRFAAVVNALSLSEDAKDRSLADELTRSDPELARGLRLTRLSAAGLQQRSVLEAWTGAHWQDSRRVRPLPERSLDVSRGEREAPRVLPTDAPDVIRRKRRE
jgi:hypothetical protein